MSSPQYNQTAYGLSQALIGIFPAPIVSNASDPSSSNLAQIGTIWINKSTNSAFILTSIVANSATWSDISGGAGVFSSLTVNPGPTNLSTVGNGAVSIGNSSNTGAITITVGTGNFSLVGAGHTVGIANDAAANLVSIGSTTGAASLTLNAGTAGIVAATSATGIITIGSAAMTGTVTLGLSTAGQIINVGNAVNVAGQTINIASGNSGANSAVNILNGAATAGTQTFNLMASGGQAGAVNIANGAAANTVIMGSTTGAAITTIQAGTGGIALSAPFTALPGPVYLYTGAGTPSNGLALHVGDMYINTTAAGATSRIYVATAAGTWTNVTCAA